jgi:hypothetical protein
MKEQRRPASNPGSYAATWSASWGPGQYQAGGLKNVYSLNFDGTDDVVTTPYTPSTIHSTGMTMSFWVKIANLSGFQIMGNWDDKGIFAGFDNSGRPDAYFGIQNVQKATTDISSYVSAGTWHHICVTASGASGVGTYYVDGVARDTLSYTADATKASITPIAIGALQQSTGLAYYMEGDIDEVAVWDKGLSASEVAGIYNGGIPTDLTKNGGGYVSSSDLQSWWRNGDATIPANDGTSSRVDTHIFDQANPGLGAELSVADPYTTGRWGGLGTNTPTFVAGESVRIDRPASGGNSAGGYVYLTDDSIGFLTEDLVATKVYKLTLLFETDDSNALVQVTGGGGHHQSSAGSGNKTFYLFGHGGGSYMTFANLDNGKFLKVSQLSVKPANGATAKINGPTIQADTP